MSTGGDANKSYDLREMEDIFSCLEIITMARGILYPVDAGLAARLEKVSDALSAFSLVVDEMQFASGQAESVMSQKSAPREQFSLDAGRGGKGLDPLDLLSDFPQSGRSSKKSGAKNMSDDDDGIVDILTGEKIR
ncbi:MAG: hypothetical protein H8E41_06645 [Desulfobulbaceae bacterium]|uniref:Uncharacterized protein n=1 Tax=Candidatus Desulfobia pelagia TaxID=2841692 RepID=A0A8J6NDS2_9BACT|nr:hypothetical protein [Candidatus Desulfobia pelagia]